jgi:hypothetical protein
VPGIALKVITRVAIGRYWAGGKGMAANCKGLYRCAG